MLAHVALALLSATSFTPKNRPYDVTHYRIDVRLHADGSFDNKVRVELVPKRAAAALELDSYGLTIKSVAVNGADTPFSLQEDPAQRTGALTLRPRAALPAAKQAVIEISYSGKAGTGHEGLFVVKDASRPDALPEYFTQFEATYARRFYPCNDEPADKATTEIFAVVDERYQVLSNGQKVLDETFTEGEEHLRRVHWRQDEPHSTYLVALAIGQFATVDVGSDVPASLHVPPGTQDLAFASADATHAALEAAASFVGVKYPWNKYDQVAVPKFYWGGMENTSLTFERADVLLLASRTDLYDRPRAVGLIAHELAHQWFGDLVTLKWWDDAWLNEGFATYVGAKVQAAYLTNDDVAAQMARSVFVDYFREEDGPASHPLVGNGPPTPDDMFDRTSYVKGAAVLRMLETWLGTAEMQKALAAYLNRYAHGNATSEEFFATVGKASGHEKEVASLANAWLHRRGYPVLTPKADWNGSAVTVSVTQRPNHADEKGLFVFKLPIVLHRDSEPAYSKPLTLVVDKAVVKATVEVPAAPEWIDWNQGGAALARVETQSVGEQEWINGARKDPDPVWRVLCAFALLGDMVSPTAGQLVRPTEAAMDGLISLLSNDPSPYVREAVLQRLGDSRFTRLPKELGPPILQLAKAPTGLSEDTVGQVRVKTSALAALGKLDFPEGRQYLIDELAKPDLDINYLTGLAMGAGRAGSSEALAGLRTAIRLQKPRGAAYYDKAVRGLATASSVEAIPLLQSALHDNAGVDETAGTLLVTLAGNEPLKATPELATFVKEFVSHDRDYGDDVKSRALALLNDVKTPAARSALQGIVAGADSQRLRQKAQQILETNFR